MSDELIISGGGSHAVATDEMLSNAANLLRAVDMTRDIVGAIEMVDAESRLGNWNRWAFPQQLPSPRPISTMRTLP